jgi:phosphatidyl-myo-inositol dimannoside synthase
VNTGSEPVAPVGPREVPRVLMVTNDFPPRVGGVQQYEWNVTRHLPPDRVHVLAPRWPGWRAHDREQSFAVERWPETFMWPTADLARRVRAMARAHRADVVLFGQGLPLPLLGPALASGGIPYAVLTHGVEVWMARVPALRRLLRRALGSAGAVTAVSRYTAAAISRAVPEGVPLTVLPPAVDEQRFRPDADGASVRERLGVGDRPIVLCVSRLVRRKGQDVLIAGMELLSTLAPGVALVLAGGGPDRARLEALSAGAPPGSVMFAGPVPDEDLPAFYAASDVFAMPCRSRWGGLEVEGFGIVFLEAAAAARPSLAWRSGGADEAVVDDRTGVLVEGSEPKAVTLSLSRLLLAPARAAAMGEAGRQRVEQGFTWTRRAQELVDVLRRAAGDHSAPSEQLER